MDADGDAVTATLGHGPLTGVRVLELGSFIAGPFAGQLLGDYGADVIKIEPPGEGDPMRRWGVTRDGDSLWWPAIARNKRSVALDLRQERARDLVAAPGRRVRRGAGELPARPPRGVGPRLRRAGGHQPAPRDGPHQRVRADGTARRAGRVRQRRRGDGRDPLHDRQPRPAAVAGRDQPRRRAGVGVRRGGHAVGPRLGPGQRRRPGGRRGDLRGGGRADGVDDGRLRAGGRDPDPHRAACCPGVAPSNVYPTADGAEVVVAANADSVFARLCKAMGRPELATDDRFATHGARGDEHGRARRHRRPSGR